MGLGDRGEQSHLATKLYCVFFGIKLDMVRVGHSVVAHGHVCPVLPLHVVGELPHGGHLGTIENISN
jgi:hypothetical protein